MVNKKIKANNKACLKDCLKACFLLIEIIGKNKKIKEIVILQFGKTQFKEKAYGYMW